MLKWNAKIHYRACCIWTQKVWVSSVMAYPLRQIHVLIRTKMNWANLISRFLMTTCWQLFWFSLTTYTFRTSRGICMNKNINFIHVYSIKKYFLVVRSKHYVCQKHKWQIHGDQCLAYFSNDFNLKGKWRN